MHPGHLLASEAEEVLAVRSQELSTTPGASLLNFPGAGDMGSG